MTQTEEERVAARRAAWSKYNRAHKAERAAHNKAYVQKEDVKARRRQMRTQPRILSTQIDRESAGRVGPTTPIIPAT
jgi:hypothetical protein